MYYVLHQRVHDGEINIGHVQDTENPADFLTKWVCKRKLKLSIDYVTNHKADPNYIPKKPGLRVVDSYKSSEKWLAIQRKKAIDKG